MTPYKTVATNQFNNNKNNNSDTNKRNVYI